MSDDLRERTPDRDLGDHPAEDGTRSDRGASDGGAPGAQREPASVRGPADNVEPLTGQGTGSAGGYGVGSGYGSSGGSQERVDGSGSEVGSETEWLRSEDASGHGPDDGRAIVRDVTAEDGIAARGDRGLGAQGAAQE